MLLIAEVLRQALLTLLIVIGSMLGLLLIGLAVQRAVREIRQSRVNRLEHRYRPLIDRLLTDDRDEASDALARLQTAPNRHLWIIATGLTKALRVVSGEPVQRACDAAHALNLTSHWARAMHDRRWWRRADAALALGLVREATSFDALVVALDDPHPEVRAAAVQALGRLGDVRAVPLLLTRLSDPFQHQPARIVDAVSMLGIGGTADLLAHARGRPEQLPVLSELIGTVVGSAAVADLLDWTESSEAAIRTAAYLALGNIGLDDRSFYYAMRALDDPNDDVRATAARALGRSGRADAARYLARHLEDEWFVAAQCASALSALGDAGVAVLRRHSSEPGRRGDLARHMLWEHGVATR